MVMVPLKPPARLDVVARLCLLMHEMPGRRDRPRPGDLEGTYDVWFDGGACCFLTNINSFTFSDGSKGWLSSLSLGLKGGVELSSGEVVNFEQERPIREVEPSHPPATAPQPSVETRTDVCAVCGGAIIPGSTVKITEAGPVHFACDGR